MRLIEDLGMQYPTENSRQKARYGLYECPICEDIFRCQTGHVLDGSTTKCKVCANTIVNKIRSDIVAKRFIKDAIAVHGDRYSYIVADYVHNRVRIQIICNTHGIFWQTPHSHKNGRGCPHCALHGFDKNKRATLYYLKITNGDTVAYKIGITNRTIQERFNNTDLEKIQVLKTWDFPLGTDAHNKEQEILKLYKVFKYTGEPLLSSGNTELFAYDVLGLDYTSHGTSI